MNSTNLLIDERTDFYLLFILRNAGEVFYPENLVFQKEYFLKYNKHYPSKNIDIRIPPELKIPCCDETTIREIKKEINRQIELIAALEEISKPELLKEAGEKRTISLMSFLQG